MSLTTNTWQLVSGARCIKQNKNYNNNHAYIVQNCNSIFLIAMKYDKGRN